ncbi:hypothetical protein BH10PSE14_BH10PSE14_06430 [soil metagenome]
MKRLIDRLLLRFRVRRLRLELDIALAVRRRGRAKRQAAARKGAETRHQHRLEGLKR